MNVLSLFDGISCGYEAFNRAGIKVANYYACEIEKHATTISNKRHQGIHRPVNDVRELRKDTLPQIDFLVGGSPCQDLSIAKKDRKGLEGDRSSLFWEYVRLKNELKPKYFILENVASMPKEAKDIITKEMGVEPIMFNAALVSAQSRKRLFWTNIKFDLPVDRGILLKHILQPDAEVDERMVVKGKAYCLTAKYTGANTTEKGVEYSIKKGQRTMVALAKPKEHEFKQIGYFGAENACKVSGQALRVYDTDAKSTTSGIELYQVGNIRKLTPVECERLQGLPDGYTEGVANTNRYKVLGNAFNVDVIAHILKAICPFCEQDDMRCAEPH